MIPSYAWAALPQAVLVFACLLATTGAMGAELNLRQMQAGFLYNFALLTDWPAGAPGQDMTVCLSEDAALTREIDAIAGKAIGGVRIRIHRLKAAEAATNCRILFLPDDPPSIDLESLRAAATLTVGEHPGFAEKGGMIELIRKHDRLGFILNLNTASKAKIRFRAQMIKLADRVIGGPAP